MSQTDSSADAVAEAQPSLSARPQRLGEMLIAKGLLDSDDLESALQLQKERADRIGRILVDLGFVAARDVLTTLAEQLGLELLTAEQFPELPIEIDRLTARFMRQFKFLPVAREDNRLGVAMVDPLDFETISVIRRFSGCDIVPAIAAETEILDAIDRLYGEDTERKGDEQIEGEGDFDATEIEHLRDMASEAPVIRYVNVLVARALEMRSSDIHVEPFEKEFRIRFRVDGVLREQESPPRELRAAIISRLKLMARLNIAERRLPQDGRIKIKVMGHEVDLRVSTLPTLYGESVVMRLLDRSATDFYSLSKLGFDDHMHARMEHFTQMPHGIFLVTGPTGSGKSTTLYSALKRINTADKKIITIEDPVEYQMDGINQIHVNSNIGLTFSAGLRHIVRQDPDVIMIGEIRDRETADIAIRSALTGHFVYSTLHTNDAPSAVTRLTDMGVENYLITSSVVAVLAQRLVRVICTDCRVAADEVVNPEGRRIATWHGTGCEKCNGTGYRGRQGIFELMEMNDEIRSLVMSGSDSGVLTAAALRNGMRPLREDGWLKIENGTTTVEEVIRVTQEF